MSEEKRIDKPALNHTFKDYVTSTSFNLSLSKNMVAYLAIIGAGHINTATNHYHFSNWLVASSSLIRRGLIRRIEDKDTEKWPGRYETTRAGDLTLSLIHISEPTRPY